MRNSLWQLHFVALIFIPAASLSYPITGSVFLFVIAFGNVNVCAVSPSLLACSCGIVFRSTKTYFALFYYSSSNKIEYCSLVCTCLIVFGVFALNISLSLSSVANYYPFRKFVAFHLWIFTFMFPLCFL